MVTLNITLNTHLIFTKARSYPKDYPKHQVIVTLNCRAIVTLTVTLNINISRCLP